MAKKGSSLKTRLLLPFMVIMLIQALLFASMILYGGVSKRLKLYAIDILSENTENSKLYLEKEIVHRWINVIKDSDSLTDDIQKILEAEHKTAADIKTDSDLNKKIMDGISQKVIDLLHRSYTTGVFVVLDGPAAINSPAAVKSGLYIRDLDVSSYAQDNSDLLLERGLPSISKRKGIPLDSFWELGFSVEGSQETTAYFNNPFNQAVVNHADREDASKFAYLSMPFSLSPLDIPVITYSQPIIADDGTVMGVIGLDMTMGQLEKLVKSSGTDQGDALISVLGVRKKGENAVYKAVVSGSGYDQYFSGQNPIEYGTDSIENAYRMTSMDGTNWYASLKKLEIYDHNTPFEEEEWVVMRMTREKDLLIFYAQIRKMLILTLLIPLAFSIVGVFAVGKIVTDPILKLVNELRNKSDLRHLSLSRVHISEIDELTKAIEKLSADVARSSSKISGILENVNVPIGVFEWEKNGKTVFCSRSLIKMLGWENCAEPYVYLDTSEFSVRMKHLDTFCCDQKNQIYCLAQEPLRWLKLTVVIQEDETTMGVFSDITADTLERKKLERERNYDILTDIFNRRAFREQVEILLLEKKIIPAAVIMWDLDNLKYINDTYGHDEGDRYIRLFADSIRELEHEGGIICRYSGDEFVTILYDPDGKDGIMRRVEAFMISLPGRTLMMAGDYRIPLRVSAGIAWYPDDAIDYDTLFNYADFAMYTGKHSVKGIVLEFDKKEYSSNFYMLAGREELNRMLESEKAEFAFQPIVTQTGKIYGYELLMRPQLKNLKGISEVLNLAKAQAKLPQMEKITWIAGMRAANQQICEGKIEKGQKLFINSIASVRLTDQDVESITVNYPDLLSSIVIELTESEPMDSDCLQYKTEIMKQWCGMIAIDDFGSGYNSESILLRMKPDIVKIDISLVHNINQDVKRQMMLKNLLTFTNQMNIMVLAEGVENAEELKTLLDFGIALFQGYYLARPMTEIRPLDPYVVYKLRTLSEKE